MRVLIILLSILVFIEFGLVFTQDIGSPCTLNHNKLSGTCKLSQHCPKVISDYRTHKIAPTICGWTETSQIVCCENQLTSTRESNANLSKSEEYCQKYQEYVYETQKYATLILGEPARIQKIDKCGYKQIPLIVGGTPAQPHEFPHMALLGYDTAAGIDWNCGGSLISERWVLTAGHCSKTRYGPPTVVRLGELNKATTTDDAKTADFTVIENIPHPDYKTSSTYNDIALLKLNQSATLSPYVRPICLPQTREIKEKRAIASGWGLIEFYGEKSDALLKVTLEVFPSNECNMIYGTEARFRNGLNDDQQICAGSRSLEQDTCEGDSGGPLQVYHPNQYCMYTIIGITSFGKGCGLAGTPGVYTRVHTYVPWIERIVWP